MKYILLTLLPILILFSSCKDQTKNNHFDITPEKIDFEKEIMNDLFLKIVDTVSFKQMYLPPPKHREKSTEAQDTIKRVIMVDSVYAVDKELINQFEEFYDTKITLPNNKPGYKFDYKIYSENKTYNFIEASEAKLDSIWNVNPNNVNGIIYFSRIQFDDTKKFGALSVEFGAGPKAGRGFIIFIKLKNNKWVIDKVTSIWVS